MERRKTAGWRTVHRPTKRTQDRHKTTHWQPEIVGSELEEGRYLGTCSSKDCLRFVPEQPRQFHKLTGQSPPQTFTSPLLFI